MTDRGRPRPDSSERAYGSRLRMANTAASMASRTAADPAATSQGMGLDR